MRGVGECQGSGLLPGGWRPGGGVQSNRGRRKSRLKAKPGEREWTGEAGMRDCVDLWGAVDEDKRRQGTAPDIVGCARSQGKGFHTMFRVHAPFVGLLSALREPANIGHHRRNGVAGRS